VLNIRDWCRIDIRLDENKIPNVLELNPLPGILPDPKDNSCFPKAARTAGYNYASMLQKVIQIAASRNGLQS
jgi:D-alanine-D-alanine ligase